MRTHMRNLLTIALLALLALLTVTPARASYAGPAQVVMEVRSTGADTNAGGFNPGTGTACTGGTDYSQQAGAQVTFDGATIAASTSGTSNTITITGYTVATTDKCNALKITGGANFTAGIYYVGSVNVGANTWTLDRNVSSGAGSAMTGKMGGALLTLAQAFTDIDNGNGGSAGRNSTIWWKSTTETITSTITMPNQMGLIVHGYQTTRGDDTGTRPLLTSATNSVALITGTSSFAQTSMTFNNVSFSHTAATRGPCFIASSAGTVGALTIINSVLDGCSTGIKGDFNTDYYFNALAVYQTEIKNCTADGIFHDGMTYIVGSHIHNNGRDGLRVDQLTFSAMIEGSVIANNAGTGVNFITAAQRAGMVVLKNSVFYANGASGFILNTSSQGGGALLINNVFEANTGYGIRNNETTGTGSVNRFNNAFYNNSLGANLSFPSDSTDIAGSASFFVNAASNNFARNNTSGAGLLLKQTGFPGIIPNAGTGYLDVGALQNQLGASTGCSCGFSQD